MPVAPPTSPSNPRVSIETTQGTIVCELFQKEAPKTVENFLKYVNEGYYTGLIFHRVIKGFVIQGGGFEPNGRQKKATHPPIKLEIHPNLVHWDGALAMARTNDPHSATCQFYITHGAQSGLDDATLRRRGMAGYAVFGKVESGMDVVKAIASVGTDRDDKPRTDVVIKSVKVEPGKS
ncbi:MAG TPA: peptidylprolyl isomerase [Candidatus Thermoplasmatota archaeon]|nr:peptidylprolyl isomerase [Candidatus Thermoplasmatota archaeon]